MSAGKKLDDTYHMTDESYDSLDEVNTAGRPERWAPLGAAQSSPAPQYNECGYGLTKYIHVFCILCFHHRRSHEIVFRSVVAILFFLAKSKAVPFVLP